MHLRKLTYLLLSIGSIMLCLLWIDSLRTWRRHTVTAPPYTLDCVTRAGDVGLLFAPESTNGYEFSTTSSRPTAEELQMEKDGRTSGFSMRRRVLGHRGGALGGIVYIVEFPMWAAYLLFVTGLLVFTKALRGAADAGKEKELAARHAAENPSGKSFRKILLTSRAKRRDLMPRNFPSSSDS